MVYSPAHAVTEKWTGRNACPTMKPHASLPQAIPACHPAALFALFLWPDECGSCRAGRTPIRRHCPSDDAVRRLDHTAPMGGAVVRKTDASLLDGGRGVPARLERRPGSTAARCALQRGVSNLFLLDTAARIRRSGRGFFDRYSGDLRRLAQPESHWHYRSTYVGYVCGSPVAGRPFRRAIGGEGGRHAPGAVQRRPDGAKGAQASMGRATVPE